MRFLVDIIDITNISNSTVHLGVSEPNPDDVYCSDETGATSVTSCDSPPELTGGSLLFDGSGIVKILPGRRFIIEESRVNLGQLQNYIDKRHVRALFLTRAVDNLTDIS